MFQLCSIDGETIIISDSDDSETQNSSFQNGKKKDTIDPLLFKYKVQPTKKELYECAIVKATQISRRKHLFSRDKLKLFLKQHCEPQDGVIKIKAIAEEEEEVAKEQITDADTKASGADVTSANAKYRYQKRGGFDATDDACMELRLSNPGLVKKLSSTSVYDLTPGEKMKILHALCGKLLTLVSTRDFIEDYVDILRQAKQEFRELKAEQHRKEREEAAARIRKRKEEKLKEQEQKMKEKQEKLKEDEQRSSVADVSIGRYWIFPSIPGLFIEEDYSGLTEDMLLPRPSSFQNNVQSQGPQKFHFSDRHTWRSALESGRYELLSEENKENGIIKTVNEDVEEMEIDEQAKVIVKDSVIWSKSIMNARCKICRKKGDAENMVLCDGCDRGHHTYCVRPKLKASGVTVNDEVIKVFNDMKLLPLNDCRYALYDATYETKESKKEDLVFIFWAPESAPLKSKMIYASSKDAIKKKFTGKVPKVTSRGVRRETTEWVTLPGERLLCEEGQSEPWKASSPEKQQAALKTTEESREWGAQDRNRRGALGLRGVPAGVRSGKEVDSSPVAFSPSRVRADQPRAVPSHLKAINVDLQSDAALQVDISDALSERDKVKFTVHTKSSLPNFKQNEFSVVRQHEEFIWLHDSFVENEDYAGYIIPPAPPRPDFDASREKLQKLGEGEGSMTKEEFTKMKQELEAEYLAIFKKTVAMHEVFLCRVAAHPILRKDLNFHVFLEYNQDIFTQFSGAGKEICAILLPELLRVTGPMSC
ncbi:hypothetical protein CB1_000886009 [Camelus ferus]|nr:hypothetical protein CB1_000886009 [Camelus ferus]